MAAIQSSVSLENKTDLPLKFLKKSNEHGVFMSTPPETISPGHTGSWEHGSDGIMTGSEGIVEYRDSKERVFHVHFTNPFVGSTWEMHHVSTNDGTVELTGSAGPASGGRADYTFVAKKK